MIKDSYQKHVYDVDVIAIYQSIDAEFNKHSIPLDLRQKFKEEFLFDCKTYCDLKGIHFDVHSTKEPFLIIPSQEPFYQYAISRMLLFYDIPQINLFLNYQYAHYYKKEDFVGLIEFIVYGIIRKQSLFNNEVRLERIMQWVEKNKIAKSKSAAGSENKVESLVWATAKSEGLQNLSAKLNLHGYIKGKTDFAKVFTHQQPTSWLKEPELLAHLLHSLYERQLFKTSKGKGYFSIAEHYFSRYSENSDKKLSLKDMSSRVNKEDIKHSKTRKEVKRIIEDSFK